MSEPIDGNISYESADVDELTAQIEAELNEYLNSSPKPDPTSTSSDSALKSDAPIIVPASATSNAAFDENDFLSWLEETPDKNPSSLVQPVQHFNTAKLDDVFSRESLDEDLDDVSDNNGILNSPLQRNDLSLSMIPTPVPQPKSSPSSLATRSMDSLFDEIFGKDRPDSRTGSPMHTHLASGLSPSSSSDSQIYVPPSRKDFGEQLDELLSKAITEGGISDVSLLRQLVSDAGYIPTEQRTIIWSLLLTGGRYVPDSAAAEIHFESSDGEGEEKMVLETQASLISDCKSVVQMFKDSVRQDPGEINIDEVGKTLFSDLHDLLVFHCLRAQQEYNPVFTKILSAIVLPTAGSTGFATDKALASSCFNALVSSFVPLLLLDSPAYSIAVNKVHSWLRLLVSYHAPALVQHLDRVLPGWEQPAKDLSTTQAEKVVKTIKSGIDLDELERELGLENDLDKYSNSWKSQKGSDASTIESAPAAMVQNHKNGHIPTHWITAIFSGSLPAAQAADLMDWAILNGERFAGLYATASLLVFNASHLLTMHAASIKTWFEKVSANVENWFRLLSQEPGQVEVDDSASNWSGYMRGWIHATSVLLVGTPQAFRIALNETEIWAVLTAEKGASEGAMDGLDVDRHGNLTEDPFGSPGRGSSAADKTSTSTSTSSSANIMSTLRNLRIPFRGSVGAGTTASGQREGAAGGEGEGGEGASNWPHDRKPDAKTVCLWSDATEVVPCICSNRRRPIAFENVGDAFVRMSCVSAISSQQDLTESVLKDRCCRLLNLGNDSSLNGIHNNSNNNNNNANVNANSPFFFGIDCRSEEERLLGLFPKAYCLDPSVLTDSEELTKLLDMLEPIASSVHICIIGVGADYFKWVCKNKLSNNSSSSVGGMLSKASGAIGSKGAKKGGDELLHLIEEHEARLNAVAMVFLKRSFLHISILDGGFVAAARFVHRIDSSFSISGALVDVNLPLLNSILEIPPPSSDQPNSTLLSAPGSFVSIGAMKPAGIATTVSSFIGSFQLSSNSSSSSHNAETTPLPSPPTPPPSSPGRVTDTTTTTTTTVTDSPAKRSDSSSRDNPPSPIHPSVSTPTPTPLSTPFTQNLNLNATAAAAKQMFSGFGKKFEMFSGVSIESLKKSVASVVVASPAAAPAHSTNTTNTTTNNNINNFAADINTSASFTIDEDDEDDGMGPKEIPDTKKISITRTDLERAHALALHKMAGTKKGDSININRKELPGAILFPAIKYKTVPLEPGEVAEGDRSAEDGDPTPAGTKVIQVHRYLVISRERFIVLDSNGAGIGSTATVKSNHHLTELIKMTFRKKDPELVTLHFLRYAMGAITRILPAIR